MGEQSSQEDWIWITDRDDEESISAWVWSFGYYKLDERDSEMIGLYSRSYWVRLII